MTFGLSLRARLRRVSFCARGKPLFQNSRFGRHRLPKRHAHGVLASLTQRASLVVLITRQKKKQPDGLFLFCLVAEMGFEPHDLRVIAPRPSSSRVVLRARQAALPKLALWKTPLAKTPCLWLFGFANPTSLARRSHNPTKEKNSPMGCFSFVCIAPLKKISAENPYDIRGFGIF